MQEAQENKVLLSKLIANHALFKEIPVSSTVTDDLGSGFKCNHTGTPYTSFEVMAAEKLLHALKDKCRSLDVVIIHDTDQDGIVSMLLIERLLRKYFKTYTYEAFPIMHGSGFPAGVDKVLQEEALNGLAVVLDHSFNADVYKKLSERYEYVYWVDHHLYDVKKDDVEINLDKTSVIIDDTRATASIVNRITAIAESSFDRDVSRFIIDEIAYLTHFNDTWQYRKGSGRVHEDLSKRARSFTTWFYMEEFREDIVRAFFDAPGGSSSAMNNFFRLIESGESVIAARKMIHRDILRHSVNKMTWTFGEHVYKIGYIFHSDARSVLSEDMLANDDEINTALVIFYSQADGKVRLSFRTRGDGPPVDLLCKLYGGGGHRAASGFAVNPEDLGSFLKDRIMENENE